MSPSTGNRPVDISGIKARKARHLIPSARGWLAAHSAVMIVESAIADLLKKSS
jgi:hypothetical protein